MIVGIATDLVSIERISKVLLKFGTRFEHRVFTEQERRLAWQRGSPCSRTYAGRWAVKEAFSKALGTGFISGIIWQDINVINTKAGRPQITLTGNAKNYLNGMVAQGSNIQIHTSIADDYPWSQAFVVIESV